MQKPVKKPVLQREKVSTRDDAWIEVCHRYIPANPNQAKRSKIPVFAYETTSEMIKVMANIIETRKFSLKAFIIGA
jgi:hypothetical protein